MTSRILLPHANKFLYSQVCVSVSAGDAVSDPLRSLVPDNNCNVVRMKSLSITAWYDLFGGNRLRAGDTAVVATRENPRDSLDNILKAGKSLHTLERVL